MSMSQQQVAPSAAIGRHGGADEITRATAHLAAMLQRMESGELPTTAIAVLQLEEATRHLEDLVAQAS